MYNKAKKAAADKARHARRTPEQIEAHKRAKSEERMLKTYGITLQEYDLLLKDQGGRCKICKTDQPSARTGRFFIDHCHDTGKIRGLLCMKCNSALGFFGDDPAILRIALEYLEQ